MSEQTDEVDWEQRIQDETELITEKTSMTIQFDFRLPLSLITEIIVRVRLRTKQRQWES